MRLKVMGLSLLVLGLMAFASTAQAGELKGDWKLRNTSGTLVLLQNTEKITGELDTVGALSIPGLNTEVSCKKLTVQEGEIFPLKEGRSRGKGKVLFSECALYEIGNLVTPLCAVYEDDPGGPLTEGAVSARANFHVVRNKSLGTAYVLAEPQAGGLKGVLATMDIDDECVILPGELIEVTGSVVFAFAQLEAVKQLVSVASHEVQLLFGDELFFGTEPATLSGTFWLTQTGAHAGRAWGIEAGH